MSGPLKTAGFVRCCFRQIPLYICLYTAQARLEWITVLDLSVFAALGQAIQLAKGIAKFPQECMKSDRRSAFYSTYNATSVQDALQFEFANGMKVFMEESLPGTAFHIISSCRSDETFINKCNTMSLARDITLEHSQRIPRTKYTQYSCY